MSGAPEVWTLAGLLSHLDFVHHKMADQPIAWVLGAGASKPSGIPTGGELAHRWLAELHEKLDTQGLPIESWATASSLGLEAFDYANAAAYYPRLYERRFRDAPEEGYAYLEDLMVGVDPSPGYSFLARALETTQHRVVVTTNFDNLVSDALAIYTSSLPFVCGHESLTDFVQITMRRPLICKIHRDLLLAPKNDKRSLIRLHEAWATTLRALLGHYSPIFIGYGGNDDSLMDLLESLESGEIRGRLIWCYYESGTPSERAKELVVQHHGVLVPVPDFDVLMVLIGSRMKITPLDHVLGEKANARLKKYQDRILALNFSKHPELADALAPSLERLKAGWGVWVSKAKAEPSVKKKDSLYRAGIAQCPSSAELHVSFAIFLDSRKELVEAEKLFRRAVELAPRDPSVLSNAAVFFMKTKGDIETAAALIRTARDENPAPAQIFNFATFFHRYKRSVQEAEALYREAMEKDPADANGISNYGCLLAELGRFEEALIISARAIELGRTDGNQLVAESLFINAISRRSLGMSDVVPLSMLKVFLSSGYKRDEWSFDLALSAAESKSNGPSDVLYRLIAASILDENKMGELNANPQWQAIPSSALEPQRLVDRGVQ